MAAVLLAGELAAQAGDSLRADTTAVVELAPIEVVGTIVPTAAPAIGSGVPARVSTVTGEEIDAWEPRLLGDALATQAGISVYDDLGSPYKVSIGTRGFSAGPVLGLPQGVSVFLDGVRQNEPDAAQVNFDLLPMEHVSRIELLSGTGSLLGPNSLGGAINLITRRGTEEREAELELSGGSFGSASVEGALSGMARGWDYYLGAGYGREDGWRQDTGAEGYNGFVNLGRRTARRGIRFQAFGATSRVEAAGSLPESMFGTPEVNFTTGDFEDLDQLQASVSGYVPLGPGRLSATLYHRRTDGERFNVNQAPDPDVRGLSENRTVGANLDWRWSRELGRGSLAFRAGFDGAVNRVRVRIFTEDPSGRTLTTDVKSPSRDAAGYLLADYRLGRVTFSGGLRYDHIRIPFEDLLDPSADTSSTFERLSPRGGVSVDLGGGGSLYASAGQSFRAPALVELTCADENAPCPLPFALGDDPPLDPVVATTYELGGRWVRGPAVIDGSVYRTDVRDDIFFIASDAALFEGYFDNIGDTRREGVELAARLGFGAGHALYANYAFSRATFRTEAELFSPREEADPSSPIAGENEVQEGDELPLVPKHRINAGGLLILPAGFRLGADVRYVGRQWLRGDEANETERLDDYVTTDLQLGWSGGPWEVTAIVTNLLDETYASFGTFNENRNTGEIERFLTPGQTRAFKLVVRRGF
ncbi:MAG TPA: TonB-dependent receptor [Gemmatimonadales bacterium]|nr:TonB-dependent receptor [Gemmatimonadales bacterium]